MHMCLMKVHLAHDDTMVPATSSRVSLRPQLLLFRHLRNNI